MKERAELNIAITGKRPKELYGYNNLERYNLLGDTITQVIQNISKDLSSDMVNIYSGGAQGADQIAFMAIDKLNINGESYSNIVCVPHEGQSDKWSDHGMFSKDWYNYCLEHATKVINTWELLDHSSSLVAKLMFRNTYMVDHADVVISVCGVSKIRDKRGGTQDTIRKALSKNKLVYNIDPLSLNVFLIEKSKEPCLIK